MSFFQPTRNADRDFYKSSLCQKSKTLLQELLLPRARLEKRQRNYRGCCSTCVLFLNLPQMHTQISQQLCLPKKKNLENPLLFNMCPLFLSPRKKRTERFHGRFVRPKDKHLENSPMCRAERKPKSKHQWQLGIQELLHLHTDVF